MKNLYFFILEYSQVHPIRFWAMVSILVLGFILALLLVWFLLKRRRRNSSLPRDRQGNIMGGSFSWKGRVIYKKIHLIHVFVLGLVSVIFVWNYSSSQLFGTKFGGKENLWISESNYIFGLDVSHYQGKIRWSEVQKSSHPIEYIFIRSTMGSDGKDKRFKENWKAAKQHNFIRGAYHYYRPNENSAEQFQNYKSVVRLNSGDFIPILDVEVESPYGRDNLRKGVLNWLRLAEVTYGVKPMIYTGLKFYQDILKGHVEGYPLWIAAYSGKHRLKGENWDFHQFTERVRVQGISHLVDGNDFDGSLEDLRRFCLD